MCMNCCAVMIQDEDMRDTTFLLLILLELLQNVSQTNSKLFVPDSKAFGCTSKGGMVGLCWDENVSFLR